MGRPVAWRKPFAFGVSFGLTTMTLGWLSGYLALRPRARWAFLVPLVVANSIEVAWVSVQRARGVASHFNFDTPFDEALFVTNGVAISVTAMVILGMTARAFRVVEGPAGMVVAIRTALVCLIVAQMAGVLMIFHGINAVEAGATQLTTWGEAGIMKVPHAVGMHGIQVLPAVAWLLSFSDLPPARRQRISVIACGGYATLVAVSVVQTLAGSAPWDVGVITGTFLAAALVALVAAAAAALAGLRRARDTAP